MKNARHVILNQKRILFDFLPGWILRFNTKTFLGIYEIYVHILTVFMWQMCDGIYWLEKNKQNYHKVQK